MWNKYQTQYEDLNLDQQPEEVKEQFLEAVNNIPFVKSLISADRPRAKDLKKDSEGKIIIDVTQPHILEDMDYFRPSAIFFQQNGCYTKLRPNPNPNSEYYKWAKEEIRRCFEGYVRPSDGEWITGDMYFFLNYCPIQLIKKDKTGKDIRTVDFPKAWEGHYYKFHYLNQCRQNGKHAAELSRRGSGKSFTAAALLAKRFILGESYEVCKKVQCVVTASEKKYLHGANQILDMFQYYIDFCAMNTQFPNKTITSSLPNMQWIMGYKDKETGVRKGSENSVVGITSKDDESKLRGSRGVLYLLEESGTFPRLLNLYQVLLPSVQDGSSVWGLIFLYGTSGDNESDFSSMQELMYNPKGYSIYPLPNVFDKEGQGRREFTFFFPGYINRANCYDKDGNSDVTKALLEIYNERYVVKYNSTNINAITKKISEIPITPQEAILRTRGNMFPVTQLNERLNELDNNPSEFDDVYVGDLAMSKTGKISWVATNDKPLREFPLKDNKANGAIEIFKMPEKDKEGNVFNHRYIAGVDPIDDDASGTVSLVSCIILDLWTDKIVCEWTGRLDYADDCYERIRLMLLFYNARCLYENNKKGMFAYFSRMNCLYLLADCPDYLRDKDMVKGQLYGNKLKGVNATLGINNYANEQIKNWLIKPVITTIKEGDEEEQIQVFNLFFIRNRALLKELILFNPDINVDRVRALGMCMLLREERVIMYQGDIKGKAQAKPNTLASDPFFMQDVQKPKEDLLDYHPHIAEIDFSNINVFKQ